MINKTSLIPFITHTKTPWLKGIFKNLVTLLPDIRVLVSGLLIDHKIHKELSLILTRGVFLFKIKTN